MSAWIVPPSFARGMPFFSAAAMYCASAMAGRTVDRHRGRDVAHVDAVEEHFHVGERVDRHAAPSNLAARLRRVGIVAHQGRHVEGDGEPVLSVLEQKVIALVGLSGISEAGELAHRPETIPVAVGVDPPRVRILARPRQIGREIETGDVLRRVDRLERYVGDRAVDGARTGAFSRTPLLRGLLPAPLLFLKSRIRRRCQAARRVRSSSLRVYRSSVS